MGVLNKIWPEYSLPPVEPKKPNSLAGILGIAFLTLKDLVQRFIRWLRFPVPRWRPATAMLLLFAIVWTLLLNYSSSSYAASYTFAQTSWTGGVSASTAAHPANESGWNKYSATTNADTS